MRQRNCSVPPHSSEDSSVAKEMGLVANRWAPLWVKDFPMFEYDADD